MMLPTESGGCLHLCRQSRPSIRPEFRLARNLIVSSTRIIYCRKCTIFRGSRGKSSKIYSTFHHRLREALLLSKSTSFIWGWLMKHSYPSVAGHRLPQQAGIRATVVDTAQGTGLLAAGWSHQHVSGTACTARSSPSHPNMGDDYTPHTPVLLILLTYFARLESNSAALLQD